MFVGFLLLVLVGGCSFPDRPEGDPGVRGIWVHGGLIATPEEADATLARIQAGRLNTVFLQAVFHGHTYYESELLEKHPDIEPDYDPLAYFLERAHQQGIAVHAWLVTGRVGYDNEPGPFFREHPEWMIMGADGQQTAWLNFTRPDVRQFLIELVSELVTTYGVDGIHFDYTRYPGPQWGFDPYSAELFADEAGADLELLRGAELPTYAHFQGNPLLFVGRAQVLAEFGNGQPAVLLNRYGAGETILLNWDASKRQIVAEDEILNRSIEYLLKEGGKLHVLRSEKNAARYGYGALNNTIAWLKDLGREPMVMDDADLTTLSERDVLILPNVYLINDQVASDLAGFVHRGGGAIFVDGPTPSIWNRDVRAVTGMHLRGGHFGRSDSLVAMQDHDILPASKHPESSDEYQTLYAEWTAFRKNGISRFLREVNQRLEEVAPDAIVSITVATDQKESEKVRLQDWPTWLEESYVDLIIPMAYSEPDEFALPTILRWLPIMQRSGRVVLGLITFSEKGSEAPKTAKRLLREISFARLGGSKGVVLFDLGRTSDALLQALANGPFLGPRPGAE